MEREQAKQVCAQNKILNNYFTHYSGTDTQGSQEFIPNIHLDGLIWFRCGMIVCA